MIFRIKRRTPEEAVRVLDDRLTAFLLVQWLILVSGTALSDETYVVALFSVFIMQFCMLTHVAMVIDAAHKRMKKDRKNED